MKRLEEIFGNNQREVESAKVIFHHAAQIASTSNGNSNPVPLVEVAKACAKDLIAVDASTRSPHPVNYVNIIEQLKQHVYFIIDADGRISVPQEAKRFFEENYMTA